MDIWNRFEEHYYLIKNIFTVTQTWKILQMLVISMLKMYGKNFEIKNPGYYHDL